MDGVRLAQGLLSLSEGIAVLPVSPRPFAVSWRQCRARGATPMHLRRPWLLGEPQRGPWGPGGSQSPCCCTIVPSCCLTTCCRASRLHQRTAPLRQQMQPPVRPAMHRRLLFPVLLQTSAFTRLSCFILPAALKRHGFKIRTAGPGEGGGRV